MGTGALAVIFLAVIMMMAGTVAILTVVYAARLPSSRPKGPASSRTEVPPAGPPRQTEEPEAAHGKTVLPSSAGPEQPVAVIRIDTEDGEQPGAELPQGPETLAAKSSNRREQETNMGLFSKRTKEQDQINRPASSGTVVELKPVPRVDVTPPVAPKIAEPPTPVQEVGRISVKPAASNEPPKTETGHPPAVSVLESADKGNAPVAGSVNQTMTPVKAEPKIDTVKPPTPEPAAASIVAPKGDKFGMGDMSDLFAKETHEDDEAGKLAKQMNEVAVEDLLKQGMGLVGRLKRPVRDYNRKP